MLKKIAPLMLLTSTLASAQTVAQTVPVLQVSDAGFTLELPYLELLGVEPRQAFQARLFSNSLEHFVLLSATPVAARDSSRNTVLFDALPVASRVNIPYLEFNDGGVIRAYRARMTTSDLANFAVELSSVAEVPRTTRAGSPIAYPVVDTGQTSCYNNAAPVVCPAFGAPFRGQDAQQGGYRASYTTEGRGTVHDHVTGLTWQQSADLNGDGRINAADKRNSAAALAYCDALGLGGHSDWRLPSIKELYSLIDFRGTDPSTAVDSGTTAGLAPFLDVSQFGFGYGDVAAGERIVDAFYVSSTPYVSTTLNGQPAIFGVNFASGRVTASPVEGGLHYVKCVRGGAYGENNFVNNGDETITDQATGLMWTRNDSGVGVSWQEALAGVASRNAQNFLGYNDWRLPNAKELQSLVDYTRSPDTTGSAAIHPLFHTTAISNEAGMLDFPYFWTNTTHLSANGFGTYAVYVAFGRGLGYSGGSWQDVHGAGAQRSDLKSGLASSFPRGHGAQGDAIRIENFVRLVRGGTGS